jgi:hypothetical protein
VQYDIHPRSLVETYAAMFGTKQEFRTPGGKEPVSGSETKFE